MKVEGHADLEKAVSAIAFDAHSVEVIAPDGEDVNEMMDVFWRRAPEWGRPDGGGRGECDEPSDWRVSFIVPGLGGRPFTLRGA